MGFFAENIIEWLYKSSDFYLAKNKQRLSAITVP
jgi:hypothetical protein